MVNPTRAAASDLRDDEAHPAAALRARAGDSGIAGD